MRQGDWSLRGKLGYISRRTSGCQTAEALVWRSADLYSILSVTVCSHFSSLASVSMLKEALS